MEVVNTMHGMYY